VASAGEYDTFLESLKKQRDLLNAAIVALEAVRDAGVPLKGNPLTNGSASSGDIQNKKRNKPYVGLTFIESVTKVLSDSGKNMTTGEIMKAVIEGGFTTNSQNARNTFSTMLHKYSKNKNPPFKMVDRATWRIVD